VPTYHEIEDEDSYLAGRDLLLHLPARKKRRHR
jgi:hypothetical protein